MPICMHIRKFGCYLPEFQGGCSPFFPFKTLEKSVILKGKIEKIFETVFSPVDR